MKTTLHYRPMLAAAAGAGALLACSLMQAVAPSATVTATVPVTDPAPTTAPSEGPTGTTTPTETPAPTPTLESTATLSPVSSLEGTVLQRSNCRYGPGPYYLYKIGLLAGAPIEAIGRNADGGWVYVQYVGTRNTCWINSKLIQVSGEIMRLQDYYPEKAPLPRATDFGPVTILSVTGAGASVTVEWKPIFLPEYALPGEDLVQYVVEIWTCKDGRPSFYTLGTNENEVTFEVDNSCDEPSKANVVAQNKAGVSGITQIALP